MIEEYHSPVGKLILGTRDNTLVLCDFAFRAGGIEKSIAKTQPDDSPEGMETLNLTILQLNEYFDGKRKSFDLPLSFCGSDMERRVWKALSEIPFGTTVSYAEIAKAIGNPGAVRAVASCIGRNPLAIVVPCHRVIGSDGKLHGYAGGLEVKRALLTLEGSLSC